MTLAVARALMESYGQGDDAVRKALIRNMRDIGRRYPNAGYGGMFRKWLRDRKPEPYNSFGNGSAMRVAAAGWLYRTLEETLHAAKLTAEVTHNHPEGIKGAQAVAASIFLARAGATKEHITAYVMDTFGYDLSRTLDEIRPGYGFFAICQKSCPEAIIAFLEGTGFEDVIRKAVSLGGDSDTIACMAGAIAEAYYGMPEKFKEEALIRLDAPLRGIVREFRRFYREHSGKPFDGWQSVFEGPESTEKQEDSYLRFTPFIEERIEEYYNGPNDDFTPVLDAIVYAMNRQGHMLIPADIPETEHESEGENEADRDLRWNLVSLTYSDGNAAMPAFTGVKKMQEIGMSFPLLSMSLERYFKRVLEE